MDISYQLNYRIQIYADHTCVNNNLNISLLRHE